MRWRHIFGALLAIFALSQLGFDVTGWDVLEGVTVLALMVLIFAAWAYALLLMIDSGGTWKFIGIVLGVLTMGLIMVAIVVLIRHFFPNFLPTVEKKEAVPPVGVP